MTMNRLFISTLLVSLLGACASTLPPSTQTENGSREYNLALGQKRAHAVQKLMTFIGVDEKQMEAISWGEEKPKAMGHDESAWAENRRADIKYSDEK